MTEQESQLLNPTAVWRNKQGKVVFALKDKEQYGYYIFERHPENMSPVDRIVFQEIWEIIKSTAHVIGAPLYELEEMELLQKKAIKDYIKKSGKVLPNYPEQVDIIVPVYDHATGSTHNLVVGVSTVSLEVAKEMARK